MRRRLLLAAAAALLPAMVGAQPAPRSVRIGILTLAVGEGEHMAVLIARLTELGYHQGANLTLDQRSAEGDPARLAPLAAELVATRPDLLISGFGTLAAKALKAATTSIPVVFTRVGDPVGAGVVASLSRPGGNVTGLTDQASELSGKTLELLREVTGGSRFAVLLNPDTPFTALALAEHERAAARLNIGLTVLRGRTRPEVTAALTTLTDGAQAGLIVLPDPTTENAQADIVAFTSARRLPSMFASREAVAAGGLMSYGIDRRQSYRRAAEYADLILKGAKPSGLPVEQPTQFHLVVNLLTAKALGITLPPATIARADEVIE
jgi:putative tryptophan/tyrosine transport system substrate-binding protein